MIINTFCRNAGLRRYGGISVYAAGAIFGACYLFNEQSLYAEEGLERLRDGPSEMESVQGVSANGGISLVESKNQLLVLTDKGPETSELKMHVADSALFFLNKTTDSLLTLEVDFGKKTTHCASTNLSIGEDNIIRSSKPFATRDFASVCFHDPGQYPYKIYGLKGRPGPVSGTIDVQ